jgi:hypothetical protein
MKGTCNMQDRAINLGCAVAWLLWLAVAVLLLMSWEARDIFLANLACPIAAAAGTATIRRYFVTSNRLMRNAFECGIDVGRRESAVPLQRVR